MAQPSASQFLTAAILKNKVDQAQRRRPSFNTQGGPFAGKRFTKQKILSNNTVYLAYRDEWGSYLDAQTGMVDPAAKIDLKFVLNTTAYLRNIFLNGNLTSLKCAYTTIEDVDFEEFETAQCDTSILNDKDEVLFPMNTDRAEDPAPENSGPNPGYRPALSAETSSVTIRCQCSHMSYYTIIEDDVEPIVEEPLLSGSGGTFADWPTVVALLYFSLVLGASLVYARAKDIENATTLKQMEEGEEELPGDHLLLNDKAKSNK